MACGPSEPPSLGQIEQEIFSQSCAFSTCHKGSSPAGGLNLEGNTHAKLVNAPSRGAEGRVRVTPGNPSASYLLDKLTLAQPEEGNQMPPGTPLSREQIGMIREWITRGALDD
jgi:hypothetical protein